MGELSDTDVGLLVFSGCLGVLGAVFVMASLSLFKDFRLYGSSIIFNISFCNMMSATSTLISARRNIEPGPVCDFQAVMVDFWDRCAVFWSTCYAINLYYGAIKGGSLQSRSWFRVGLAVYGLSGVLVCVAVGGDALAPAGKWCWVDKAGWQFGLFYVFVFVGLSVNLILYVLMMRGIRRFMQHTAGEANTDRYSELKLFWRTTRHVVVFVCIWTVPSILRVWDAVDPDNTTTTHLWSVMICIVPLQGFGNALVLLSNKTVRRLWVHRLFGASRSRAVVPQVAK